MKQLKKTLAFALAGFAIFMYCPWTSFAQEALKKAESSIQTPPIEVRSTPDEALSVIEGKGTKWWLWGLIGVLIVGGAVALSSGSDESGGGGGSDPTGSATISW